MPLPVDDGDEEEEEFESVLEEEEDSLLDSSRDPNLEELAIDVVVDENVVIASS